MQPLLSGFSRSLLQNKVGLVTGAGSPYGIGRSLVLGLAAAGARAVYATDLSLGNIASLQEEVRAMKSDCEVHGALLDVTDEKQTISVLKEVLDKYGRMDFYFANAGVGNYVPLQNTDAEYYDKMISIMQRSFFLALRYGGQAMCNMSEDKPRPGGSIVVTSSIAGVSGGISDISYSSAKAAVANMVKPGSVQLAASNIRVNSIAPGFVRSSIIASTQQALASPTTTNKTITKEEASKAFDATLGRLASDKYYFDRIPEPEEIASIGVFLASELGASVNGQNIVADSGKTASGQGDRTIGPIPAMSPL